jgi:hypothetical protein
MATTVAPAPVDSPTGPEPMNFSEFQRSGLFNMFLKDTATTVRDRTIVWEVWHNYSLYPLRRYYPMAQL